MVSCYRNNFTGKARGAKATVVDFGGKFITYNLGGVEQRWTIGVKKYEVLRTLCKPNFFSIETGEGEQRQHKNADVLKLEKACRAGKYRPETIKIGTTQAQRDSLKFGKDKVEFQIGDDTELPLLDGHRRFTTFEKMRKEGGQLQVIIDNLMIPYILLLDGDNKEAFVAYQEGVPMDKNHLLSLRSSAGLLDDLYSYALNVARRLHKTPDSFCHNLIKFDTKSNSKLPLSVRSLCADGSSGIAFSLIGSAKVGKYYKFTEEFLTECILKTWKAISEDKEAVTLLDPEFILAPEPNGTNAGTTLLVALGNMLACRTGMRGKTKIAQDDLDRLVQCAMDTCQLERTGLTSIDGKRKVLKGFALEYFADLVTEDVNKDVEDVDLTVPPKVVGAHHGIPVTVVRLLSPGTFGLPKLPTVSKKKVRKAKAKSEKEEVVSEADELVVVDTKRPVEPDWVEEDKEIERATALLQEEPVEDVEDDLDEDLEEDELSLANVGGDDELPPWEQD